MRHASGVNSPNGLTRELAEDIAYGLRSRCLCGESADRPTLLVTPIQYRSINRKISDTSLFLALLCDFRDLPKTTIRDSVMQPKVYKSHELLFRERYRTKSAGECKKKKKRIKTGEKLNFQRLFLPCFSPRDACITANRETRCSTYIKDRKTIVYT